MHQLCSKIGYTKKRLYDLAASLDDMYKEFQDKQTELKKYEKEKIKELQNLEMVYHKAHPMPKNNADSEKIAMKIMSRMVYLNRQPKTDEVTIRLEELSKILDWIETN